MIIVLVQEAEDLLKVGLARRHRDGILPADADRLHTDAEGACHPLVVAGSTLSRIWLWLISVTFRLIQVVLYLGKFEAGFLLGDGWGRP